VSWLIRERGIGLVAVTRGAKGARLVTASGQHEHPGVELSSEDGDPVGAGDAFSAALGLQLSHREPMSVCLARANRYASHVASHAGGMPPPPAWLSQGS
ncbi:MAG TPA: PfkB family carbohydrate kinase, partial [Polyangiaceae bacterium]|nr:PfkB family carbohydrate kinase [Polyangiaceae bacterium]